MQSITNMFDLLCTLFLCFVLQHDFQLCALKLLLYCMFSEYHCSIITECFELDIYNICSNNISYPDLLIS